jgi:hypothetical protein
MAKGSRDHVFPEGLGSFSNALVYNGFCGVCNNECGKLEHHLLSQSFYTTIRSMLGISSVKRKKGPFVDRIRELRERGKSNLADVTVNRGGMVLRPEFCGSDVPGIQLPPIAELHFEDGRIDYIELTGLTPREAADKVIPIIKSSKATVYIKSNQDIVTEITSLITSETNSIAAAIELEPGTGTIMQTQGSLTGTVNGTHIKAMGFILLKALLLAGFDREALENLIGFIHKNSLSGIQFNLRKKLDDAGGITMQQHMFRHTIQWRSGMDAIIATVIPFHSDRSIAGAIFRIQYPRVRKILSPPYHPGHGSATARYHRRNPGDPPGRGECSMTVG